MGDLLSFEELMAEIEKFSPPWHWRARRAIRNAYWKVRRIPREIRWFIQRGRRGWSDYDTWNLDVYLSRVISESVKGLLEVSHGSPVLPECTFPCESDCVCEDTYTKRLTQIADGFAQYGNGESDAASLPWDLLREEWQHLWD